MRFSPHEIHKNWGGAGFVFLALLLTVSGAFARTKTLYVDPIQGKASDSDCTSPNPSDTNGPCTLTRAFTIGQADGNTFLIRVRRSGATVTLAPPATIALFNQVTFGTYISGSSSAVEGTIEFTGTFLIGTTGQFILDPNASVQFKNITLGPGTRLLWANGEHPEFFKVENGSEKRMAITGTLQVGSSSVSLKKLVVSKSFTLAGNGVQIQNELTVKHGATLTLETNLWVSLRKGKDKEDTQGILTIDGAIVGTDKNQIDILFIAGGNNAYAINGRGTSADAFFHTYTEYTPAADGAIDHTDCVRITGDGVIRNMETMVRAYGNVCIELKEIGSLQATGSIQSPADGRDITSDVIFKNDVVVGGYLEMWNDSRVVFEKTALIRGILILDDGTNAITVNRDWYGTARTTSIRKGVQTGGSGSKYSCAYVPGKPALHIPGVQFEGAATIMGELQVRANNLRDEAPHATTAPACAPRVLFLAPEVTDDTPAEGFAFGSSIVGDLAIEDTADFYNKGRVYLDSRVKTLSSGATRRTAHVVRLRSDLSAKGSVIGMAHPVTMDIDGMCTENDTGLLIGNYISLANPDEKQFLIGQGSELMLDALVAFRDVEVDRGPLTVKTLYIDPNATLTANKNVKVTESLLLQGELDGELDESSTIKRLTYGNRNTDLVKKAALHTDGLDALAIHVGSGELRLDEVYKTKNLGLCSGTLSLVDVESTTDSTLHVTEQITVQNGMLAKDTNDPGSLSTDIANATRESPGDRYMLKYITPGKREVMAGDLEWFDPKDVEVDHKDAEITASGDRSIIGKLTITKGKLLVDGMLTVGTSSLDRGWYNGNVNVDKYSVVVTAGELHTKGQDMLVQGRVTVKGKSKLMTGGGDLQVLGRVEDGQYANNTATVLLDNKEAVVDLGEGTLLLGPADTKKRNNLRDENGFNTGGGSGVTSRPDASLTLTGSLTAGMIKVPKGSKETIIDVRESSDDKLLETVVFDGTKTPGTGNIDGTLYLRSATTAGKMLTVDSLSAMQGSVETSEKKVVITKDVALRSATILAVADTTEFMGDVMVSGTGGLNADVNKDTKARSVLIHGAFTQRKGTTSENLAGVKLDSTTTKTVMGNYVVDSDTVRYVAEPGSKLILHGDFHFAKSGKLGAMVEFTGKKAQMVQTDAKTELHSITVDNSMGLKLASDIMQQRMATLTLRRGKIHSMPMDSMFMWTVQNVDVEQELRGRSSAQEGSKCGADNDEACQVTILRGSSQSYVGGPVVRHLLQGNAGAGFESGGYLYPVGMEEGAASHYRPLILQLPSDLNDTTAVTVSPVMVPEGAMPDWENLMVPMAGGSLTLDVHADLFWKVDLGTESLPTNTNLRVAAAGLRNVSDATGLRIVQWDCEWENPKLAGRVPAQSDASSFAINGYLNGVVHLTQEGIGLGSCAIFGIAANGRENPIDQADLGGGQAMVQFIHNVPLPTQVEVHLGDIRIGSGMQFRSATAYRPVGAGSHVLKIQAAGVPAEQAITSTLSLNPNTNTVVIAHGSLAEPKLKMLDMRMTSSVATKAEVRLVHGSADLGAAQVQVMDRADPMMPVSTLAGNLMQGDDTRRYASLDPLVQVMRVKSADGEVQEFYELDLYGYGGQTLVLNLSGMRNDLTILGVDRNGEIVPIQTVTGVEEGAELPTEFALHGNYPNPFNPSTRIQFDLPESAQVQVQIVDLLGREVMALPAQEFEAGANRGIELQATSLASGTYLYRLIATGAEQRHVKTGRMMLVK